MSVVDAPERKATTLSSFPHDLDTHRDAQRHTDADREGKKRKSNSAPVDHDDERLPKPTETQRDRQTATHTQTDTARQTDIQKAYSRQTSIQAGRQAGRHIHTNTQTDKVTIAQNRHRSVALCVGEGRVVYLRCGHRGAVLPVHVRANST